MRLLPKPFIHYLWIHFTLILFEEISKIYNKTKFFDFWFLFIGVVCVEDVSGEVLGFLPCR